MDEVSVQLERTGFNPNNNVLYVTSLSELSDDEDICETTSKPKSLMIQIALHSQYCIVYDYVNGTLDGKGFHKQMQYKILPAMRKKASLETTGFMIDGAPPHHTKNNMSYLDRVFKGRIIQWTKFIILGLKSAATARAFV